MSLRLCTRSMRLVQQHARRRSWRTFATTSAALKDRSIVYTSTGSPDAVLRAVTIPSLSAPAQGTLNIRYILSPINPADVNVVQGVYPAKPSSRPDLLQYLPDHAHAVPSSSGTRGSSSNGKAPERQLFVGGNEGLAQVTAVGPGVKGPWKEGDWVVMVKPQSGTWASSANVKEGDVVKIPMSIEGVEGTLSEEAGAMMTVNPPTAYNMLHDFVSLKEGDWVIQNGANSAVGQLVIQLAANYGWRTINLVRDRDDIDDLKHHLHTLGATYTLTYEELADKSTRDTVKSLLSSRSAEVRLALNCISGPSAAHMCSLLSPDATLVSYGAMSKEPLSLPTSLFIFKNLTSVGFWMSRWYKEQGWERRVEVMKTLVGLHVGGKLKVPAHEIVTLKASDSDEDVTKQVREVMQKTWAGMYGKKVLLKIEDIQ